jgi:hypothetical protein
MYAEETIDAPLDEQNRSNSRWWCTRDRFRSFYSISAISLFFMAEYLLYTNDVTTLLRSKQYLLSNKHIVSSKSLENSAVTVEADVPLASCVWLPGNTTECSNVLTKMITGTFDSTNNEHHPIPRRWLFMGDSTMARLWSASENLRGILMNDGLDSIRQSCPGVYSCSSHNHERCGLTRAYGLTRPNHQWKQPNTTLGEGPIGYGLKNPYCQDCSGCNSAYVQCHLNDPLSNESNCAYQRKLKYGGFLGIEFARDVEVQSAEFLTTQQNLARFIETNYNSPFLIQHFGGKPVCVVRTGLHDLILPQMTTELFLKNVIWYLHLMRPQCSKLVWLQNTAPLRLNDKDPKSWYLQTVESITNYNNAVYDFLKNDQTDGTKELRKITTVVDVFEASKAAEFTDPEDNVHKCWAWYSLFSAWWREIIVHTSELG